MYINNLNKQSHYAGHTLIYNVVISVNILTCMDNYIWQCLVFTEVGFTAKIWLKRYDVNYSGKKIQAAILKTISVLM